jgi:hypothetical protein
MKTAWGAMVSLALSACALTTVTPDQLQPGSADAVTFKTTGRPTYDEVWRAAMKAMGTGMTIVQNGDGVRIHDRARQQEAAGPGATRASQRGTVGRR